MSLQNGQVLNNRYRITTILGQGGFGAVYQAWDLNLQKICAVKENFSATPDAHEQFNFEATVLANLHHPNLPRVTDYFVLPQGQYLVMDFVEGEDLEQVSNRLGRVPLDTAVNWISQIADVLSYLHTHTPPIIHRDIKPANIRVTPQGQAMLVDFGIAKEYDPVSKTTRAARAVTPGFSPPEQYGFGQTDGRSDEYALAATLYYLLTGQEVPESVTRITGDTMTLAHQVNLSVPLYVGAAIQRALSLDSSKRFQSVSEFKAALASKTVPPTQIITPPPLPWRFITIAGIIGFVLILSICGIAAIQFRPQPTEAASLGTSAPASPIPEDPTAQRPTRPPTEAPDPSPTEEAPATTRSTEPPLPPSFSPTSGQIAIRSNRSGFYEIAVMNADGSGFRQLTSNQNITDEPDFSPDGRQIVFERKYGDGNDWEIHIIDADGGSEYSLGSGRQPAWSPDGEWIAFEDNDGTGALQLWIMRADGSSRQQLTRGNQDRRAPNWSPDSRQLVYMKFVDCIWQLAIIDVSTRQETEITFDSTDKRFPVWSPDGQWLAYNARDITNCNSTASGSPTDIWIVDINGNHSQQVTNGGSNGRPGWSPDSNYLLFNAKVNGLWKIVRIDRDGSNYEVISNDGNDEQPDWSP